jgi:hypothetical protein
MKEEAEKELQRKREVLYERWCRPEFLLPPFLPYCCRSSRPPLAFFDGSETVIVGTPEEYDEVRDYVLKEPRCDDESEKWRDESRKLVSRARGGRLIVLVAEEELSKLLWRSYNRSYDLPRSSC